MLHCNVFQRAQRWEFVDQIRMAQLHDPFRAGNTAQLMSAQIGQPRVGREHVDN